MSRVGLRMRQVAGHRLVAFAESLLASSYKQRVLQDEPTSYWRLGEDSGTTAVDEMGANNGTYSNVALGVPGALAGTSDLAASFDGAASYGYVDIPTELPEGKSTFSLEAWISTDTLAAGHRRVFNQEFVFYCGMETDDLTFYLGNGTSWVDTFITTATVAASTWYHVVWVKDGTSLTIYVDGDVAWTGTATVATTGTNTNGCRIGLHSNVNTSQPWEGDIDEVAFYDYALSPQRIGEHYQAGKGVFKYPMVVMGSGPDSYYKWDEGSGSGVVNFVGSPNGTFKDGAQAAAAPVWSGSDGPSQKIKSLELASTYRWLDAGTFPDPSSALTLGIWFKAPAVPDSNAPLIGFASAYGGASHDKYMFVDTSGQVQYYVWTGTTNYTIAPVNVCDGEWHFIVVTHDGSTSRIYVDGILEASQGANPSGTYTHMLMVNGAHGGMSANGAWATAGEAHFAAPMFASKVLTLAQIKALHLAGYDMIPALLSGGTTSSGSGYSIHKFTTSGTLTVDERGAMDVLVVAGGGSGGSDFGGGGGAGGLIYQERFDAKEATYAVTVGSGGAQTGTHGQPNRGGDSSLGEDLVAIGGGGAANGSTNNAQSGGSGGGGGGFANSGPGGAGTTDQGFAGGTGAPTTTWSSSGGGGGGGAGGAGQNGAINNGGDGGPGLQYDIDGTLKFYAGGGGGNVDSGTIGQGGSGIGGAGGGGGSGAVGGAGAANTGSGGGGGGQGGGPGGAGGSGVVVVRTVERP